MNRTFVFFKNNKTNAFKKGQKFFPAPDLVIEVISKGTAKRGRGIKYDDYKKHQVEEYWIVDPKNETLKQYHLKKGKYELLGLVRSFAVKGLEIPIEILFDKKKHINLSNKSSL